MFCSVVLTNINVFFKLNLADTMRCKELIFVSYVQNSYIIILIYSYVVFQDRRPLHIPETLEALLRQYLLA